MDIVDRLKEQAVGREEWRVANPDDGSYVISFSCGDTLSPELYALEWLTRNQTSRVAGYEVRKVIAQSDADMLMIAAEREACAKVCDNRYMFMGDDADRAVEGCAAAIRYRNVESC